MPLQIDFCTTLAAAAAAAEAEAASHYFLICFSRFAFACFFALFVFFFLLLFASFCALHSWNSRRLRAFAFCFLLFLSLLFSTAAQAALRSQLFNCVCVFSSVYVCAASLFVSVQHWRSPVGIYVYFLTGVGSTVLFSYCSIYAQVFLYFPSVFLLS